MMRSLDKARNIARPAIGRSAAKRVLPLRRALGLSTLAVASLGLAAAAPAQVPPPSPPTPWQAPATTVTEATEVSFRNGDTVLSGTLYAPRGEKGSPAIVVTHGASSATRDLALYRHLIDMLPPLGIAVFVYDRRGSGKSGGDLKASDYTLLADDAIAAQRAIASDARVDPDRIGFWGLSQGGWLALLAASRNPRAAFAISVSAPMTPPDIQMNFATANILRIKGYPPSEVDILLRARHAVDAHLRGQMSAADAQKALDAAVARPWFPLVYMSPRLGDPKTSRWLKEMSHDPVGTLEAVKVPALLIFGAVDPWIPVATSLRRIDDISRGRANIETVVVPGADHAMMTSASPATQMDPASFPAQAPEAPAYFATLAAWLAEQGLTRGEPRDPAHAR